MAYSPTAGGYERMQGVPPQGQPYAAPPQGQPYAAPPQGQPYAAPPQGQPYAAPPPGQPYAAPGSSPALADPKAHPRLGINAQRSCTDWAMYVVIIVAWCAMVYVAHLAFANGDPERLIRGTDYLANTCGVGAMADRPVLWYPFSFNTKSADIVVSDALKLGLCVAECPAALDRVPVYGTEEERRNLPDSWLSLFDSTPKFYRCFPDFGTYRCEVGSGNGSTATTNQTTHCEDSIGNANQTWAAAAKFDSVWRQGFDEVRSAYWVIIVSLLVVIVLSFAWLFLLRCFVKPVVILTALLVLAALIGVGAFLWWVKGKKEALDPPQTTAANWYMAGAIVAWIFAFLYLCAMIFLWRDVMTACDIIEEATKVPLAIPPMVLVPPVALVAVIPFLVFALYVAIYIQSSGDVVTGTVPGGTVVESVAATFANVSSNTTAALTKEYTFSNWRVYAHLYNLFIFLWAWGFFSATGYMTLALCAVYWYWSNPGDVKTPPTGSVCQAGGTVLRYHLGTVLLGSLLVSIVQILRIMLLLFEKHIREFVGKERSNSAVNCLIGCLHCCLACLERIVRFINKNGYIMCAMQGSNFLSSARKAVDLIVANALSVTAVSIISEYVMLFGKVIMTVAAALIAWALLDATEHEGETNGVLVIIIVALLAFLISCLFSDVFSVCIDTILLCFCFDKQEVGDDYFPKDLAAHVDAAVLKKGAEMKAQEEAQRNYHLGVPMQQQPMQHNNPQL